MIRFLKKYWLVSILILLILITRLLIFNKEAVQFFADEGRYPILVTNLEEASKSGDYSILIKRLFNNDARPGAGLFYYPSAFLEWKNPGIPFGPIYNLAINILSLTLIFFIVKKNLNRNEAIIVTLLITLSISSLIYIRHMIPYDIALFLLILGLFFYVYFKKSLLFGILAGLSFLTYPSYYYYLFPLPLFLFLYSRSIKPALLFIVGIFIILISTHLFSIFIGGELYFRSLQIQSGGVTAIHQGDYLPAANFISEYILATDGVWNLLLILISVSSLIAIKNKKRITFFALYLLMVFLILEFTSHILEKHVLYGRTVRPLYLMTLCFAGLTLERALNNLKNKRYYILGVSILILVTVTNWWPRFAVYKNLVYPKQFQQKAKDYLNSKYGGNYDLTDNAVFVNYWDKGEKVPIHFFNPEKGEAGKFYIMNAVQMYPYYGNYNMNDFCQHEVLLKELHIQAMFKSYLFEGYKRKMREEMRKDPLYYQLIYCQS